MICISRERGGAAAVLFGLGAGAGGTNARRRERRKNKFARKSVKAKWNSVSEEKGEREPQRRTKREKSWKGRRSGVTPKELCPYVWKGGEERRNKGSPSFYHPNERRRGMCFALLFSPAHASIAKRRRETKFALGKRKNRRWPGCINVIQEWSPRVPFSPLLAQVEEGVPHFLMLLFPPIFLPLANVTFVVSCSPFFGAKKKKERRGRKRLHFAESKIGT